MACPSLVMLILSRSLFCRHTLGPSIGLTCTLGNRTVEPFLGPRLAKLEMAKMKLPFSSSNEELLPTDMSIPETELTANSP